ncbi:MAG: winged helix-turn-helix transcriptional regulator [Thermoplasmata archaeon]|nr:MAG: winged helix-turn-helix transcriptional regulator [Thermoplasmata archaeon]
MADKSIAKAFRRKIGPYEGILTKTDLKVGESSLLMNPSRARIFELICNFPGSHLRAISRKTGYSVQNVRWHLRKMRDADLISESSLGRKKIYTPLRNIIDSEECRILALLNRDDTRRVYLAIEAQPKKTQRELCDILNTYQQMLSLILLSLEDSDLVTVERIDKKKVYSVTDKIERLKEAFYEKSDFYQKALISALEADSLNPRIEKTDADTLSIRLEIGGGEASILKINRNPFTTILKIK